MGLDPPYPPYPPHLVSRVPTCGKKTGSIDQSSASGATFPNAALATPAAMNIDELMVQWIKSWKPLDHPLAN